MTAQMRGYKHFESIRNNLSRVDRRFVDEWGVMCGRERFSLLPYSPMAGGVLSGKYNNAFAAEGRFSTYMSSENPRVRAQAARFVNEKTLASTNEYIKVAEEAGISPVTLATA